MVHNHFQSERELQHILGFLQIRSTSDALDESVFLQILLCISLD